MKSMIRIVLVVFAVAAVAMPIAAQQADHQSASNPLVQLLQSKGILSAEEAATVRSASTTAEANERLARLLWSKGLISQEEYNSTVAAAATSAASAANTGAGGAHMVNAAAPVATGALPASTNPTADSDRLSDWSRSMDKILPGGTETTTDIGFGTIEPEPAYPAAEPGAEPNVLPAFAPIRVLPVGLMTRDSVKPVIGIGPIHIQPYGFIKANVIEDSSNPFGGDAPLSGMLVSNTGPNPNPEFHLNARSSRFGANFEWLDSDSSVVITGKLEMDFEGNFTSVFNRGISSIRSSMLGLRLAYGRVDYHANDHAGVFGEFGQNWSMFCSSTLPSSNETTLLGVEFGSCYERLMGFRFGTNYRWPGSRKVQIQPEFGIYYPGIGNGTATSQASIGERTGADANQPEWQARLALQFQLDPAPKVAPAQLIVSGMLGKGELLVGSNGVPGAFTADFPGGAKTSFRTSGFSAEAQLPTRWATLQVKYWAGEALRYYFVNNLLNSYNATAAFLAANPTGSFATATSLSAEGTAVAFGCTVPLVGGACPLGSGFVLPQQPIRGVGGFADLGIPLSRIFNADPKGRNAGWTLNLHYGVDQSRARDLRSNSAVFNPITDVTTWSGVRYKNDWAAATLNYKFNSWWLIGFEEGYYRTRSLAASCAPTTANPVGCSVANPFGSPLVTDGRGIRSWHDTRTQITTIFFF
jgi:hypothetical protein